MNQKVQQTRITRNIKVIEETFAPLAGSRILDIGCGSGHLCRALARRQSLPTGIDVSGAVLTRARVLCPDLDLVQCSAENLPFEDGSFDGAVMMNSLHHVPKDAMERALREALRCIGRECRLLILEPEAAGPWFEIMQPLDDETEVRAWALEAIDRFCRWQPHIERRQFTYETSDAVSNVDQLIGKAVEVDQRRKKKADRLRSEIDRRLHLHAVPSGQGFVLGQPMVAIILSRVGRNRPGRENTQA